MAADRTRQTSWLLFGLLFVVYGYFFQGGGWNQNVRFDQVRAVVEQRSLAVDDYLLYRAVMNEQGVRELERVSLPAGVPLEDVHRLANTGDLATHGGRLYPNKPPGTTLLALPAYAVIYGVERLIGVDPDRWWTVTFNHYLVTWLSVGLLGALGGVIFLATSRRLFPALDDRCHVAATLAFGLGTLVLPFSTMLFDHVEAATLLLAGYHGLLRSRDGGRSASVDRAWVLGAGAAFGLSVVVNYLSIVVVAVIVAQAAIVTPRERWLRDGAYLIAGGVPFALLLGIYHAVCFGSPLAIANTFQSEMFREEGLVLGVFGIPDPLVAGELLVGLRRGILWTSPVLVAAVAAAVWMLRGRERRVDASLFLVVFGVLWLINASFREWHAGFSIGPRYLIPALPFVCLPLARAFASWPRGVTVLAGLSVLLTVAVTAIDPQPPPKFPSPLTQYLWPLVTDGQVSIEGTPVEGPVSANPIGTYEAWYYRLFPPGSEPARWASFNVGELLWPRSLASLLPLVLVLLAGGALLRRSATDDDQRGLDAR